MSNTGWVPDAQPQQSGWVPDTASPSKGFFSTAWDDMKNMYHSYGSYAEKIGPSIPSSILPIPQNEKEAIAQREGVKAQTPMLGAAAGAMIAPEFLPAEAGLVSTALAEGAGAGLGTSGGTAAIGQNPFTKENLEEAGINAAATTGGSMLIGGVSQLLKKPPLPTDITVSQAEPATGGVWSKIPSHVPVEKLDVVPATSQFQPALANTPRETLNYAASKGIDLTPGQATGAPIPRTVEAIGNRSILGADKLADARNVNAIKLARNVRGIADQVDPKGMGLSEEQAGETIKQTAQVARDISHENATNAYQQLPPDLTSQPVDVSGIRSKYFQQLKEAQTSLANRAPETAAQIKGTLSRAANLGTPDFTPQGQPFMRPELSFADAMKVRSDALRDGAALVRAGAPNEVEGISRNLAGDIDSAMESTANKAGYTDQWRQANAGWKDYMGKYSDPQSPFYRILNQADPATVTRNILNRGSAADIELLKSENMAPALDALKRQTIVDIANHGFRIGGDGLGGYSDSFLNTLFGRPLTKELYLNGELARRMNFELNPSGTSNVLLGMEQVTHPGTPSRWGIPMGAAKYSMPRPAASYLPGGPTQ